MSFAISVAYAIESFAHLNRISDRITTAQMYGYSYPHRLKSGYVHRKIVGGFILGIKGVQGISLASAVVLLPLVGLVFQLAGIQYTVS